MAVKEYRGARIKRIEDPRLLRGRGNYVDDLAPPGLWHVVIVRSPHAHARIRRIRSRKKVAVVTAHDLGKDVWLPGEADSGKVAKHPVLAAERVCYVGQPVVAVLARTLAEAVDAATEVEILYDPLPTILDPVQALHNDGPVLHPNLKTNVVYRKSWARGGVASAFQDPPMLIAQRIVHQRVAAITLEGRAVLAAPPQHGERTLTVWSSTQMPHGLRDELVEWVPRGISVRVVAPDVGGGFGAKGNIYPEEFLIPLLALQLDRPLKWVESRQEHMQALSHGRSQFADVSLAATREVRVLGLRLRIVADVGAYVLATTAFIPPLTLGNVLNVNGKIFAMLVKGEFVAKLPKGRLDELVRGSKGKYFDPGHGRLMKEWVVVGAGKASWVDLAKEAYRFVKSGKP